MYELTCQSCKHVMKTPFARMGAMATCAKCKKRFAVNAASLRRTGTPPPATEPLIPDAPHPPPAPAGGPAPPGRAAAATPSAPIAAPAPPVPPVKPPSAPVKPLHDGGIEL